MTLLSVSKISFSSTSNRFIIISTNSSGSQGGSRHAEIVVCEPRVWTAPYLAPKRLIIAEHTGQHSLDTPMCRTIALIFYLQYVRETYRTQEKKRLTSISSQLNLSPFPLMAPLDLRFPFEASIRPAIPASQCPHA